MATHSSILACRILWTEEPGGLQSIESQRVGNSGAMMEKEKYSLTLGFQAWETEKRVMLTLRWRI